MKVIALISESASTVREVNFPIRSVSVAHFDREDVLGEPDERLTGALHLPAGEYTFTYDYPLEDEAEFKHHLTERTSILDILELGAQDYKAIYDEEGQTASADPTPSGALLNRGDSHGKYGIWSHDIEDLVFEGVRVKNFKVKFNIGS